MEQLVVTLDTAQKLKAAGFPERTYFKYRLLKNGGSEMHRRNGGNSNDGFDVSAPTAQEITDQLPKIRRPNSENIYLTLEIDPFEQCWVAEYKDDNYNTQDVSGMADTLAEAVAAPWLKLHEEAK